MTLAQARACLARGVQEAERLGFKVAIAVVDAAGHLVACERMDGALWVTPEIARAKANAAAGFHASTLDLEERFSKRMLFA
ncbi:MAG TPA: heme-binding protein, partial [Terriglobales bacterium]|nr:heme-binding protein [Terriglobales bacterium]